jgi:uncharacterized membrane protein YtjA (UPF0391 family)
MKYLFLFVKNVFALSFRAFCQACVALWHFDLKHNVGVKAFYEGDFDVFEVGGMLQWTVIFLVTAITCAVFGFGGIAGEAASVAKMLFFIFLVIFVLSLIAGGFRRID